MEIVTQKYIRKPLFVDAVQVSVENFSAIATWCMGEIRSTETDLLALDEDEVKQDPSGYYIHVRVNHPKNIRQTKAMVGDWILYTDKGYKIYTDTAFQGSWDLWERDSPADKVEAVKKQVG
jgi:hypothetical protein